MEPVDYVLGILALVLAPPVIAILYLWTLQQNGLFEREAAMFSADEMAMALESLSIDELLAELRNRLKGLPDEKRHEILAGMVDGYCRHCGAADPRCRSDDT